MLYPMFAMVLLTFVVGLYLFALRRKAVSRGDVKISAFRLNNDTTIPSPLQQAARNYSNLFEMPVLFYIAGTLALILQIHTLALILTAWLFVVARLFHTLIHITSNNVIHRLWGFMTANVCLFIMWVLIVANYASR